MDKNNRYDRQIRLWGDHGQAALELARVCLINATATGTEVLKNLVLPGIGAFTIIDGSYVSGEDAGHNFFITSGSIGKSRASVTKELLMELNSEVVGESVEESVESILNNQPDFFYNFTIVIATDISESCLLSLSKVLWDRDIPLIICRTYGFIGYIRLVVKEHTVIESHPDNVFDDLRLDRPFPGLQSFCDKLDFSKMDKKTHSHTPWLVIIYKFLEIWRSKYGGEIPKTYKDKKEFKNLIREGILISEKGAVEEEENFEEAITHTNTALRPTTMPSTVKSLFEDFNCKNITVDSSKFWIMTHALKEFVRNEGGGYLPLRGSIPDMTSDSERYIQLQNVYRLKSSQDIACYTSHLHRVIQSIGLGLSEKGISERDIELFCRNASFLRVLKGHSIEDEYGKSSCNIKAIADNLESEESDEIVFYVLLRAVDRFHNQFNRFPGWFTDQVETDILQLKLCVNKLLSDWGLSQVIKDEYIHEMCRYGGCQVNSVDSVIGGAAAQEIIKVISNQFIPINNTFIYNAMKQTSSTFFL